MSQNVSTKTIASEELQEPISPGTVAVESYADRLMDDLFEDVDRILVGGNHLPTDSARSEYVSLKPMPVPAIVMPPMMSPAEIQKRADAEKTVEAKVVTTDNKQQESNQWFDKWLLGAACCSLVIMLGLWLATRAEWQRMSAKAPAPAPSPIAPSPTISASDAKFANYVVASLDKIAQKNGQVPKTAAGTPTVTAPAPQQQSQPTQQSTTINLPALPLSLNLSDATSLAQALNRLATALEKVAIPTANNAQNKPAAPKPPTAKATPSAPKPAAAKAPTAKPSPTAAASSPTAFPTAAPSPAATASPTTAPSPTAAPSPTVTPSAAVTAFPEIQAQPAVPTIPAEIPAPAAETAPPPPVEPSAEPSVNATTLPSLEPAAIHTLVGILELGERSAALFEINGVARRVNIGESIGSSGWALVEVANQEAVIRRNGEVRSIYVGQKF